VRTRPVGAPISAASLKHLNGQDSSGERPHPSSTQNAAVRSSAGHRARDGSGQGSSFIYMPRQQRKGTHNSVSEIDARTGEREEQCKYRERRCPSALPKPRRRAAWESATALCAPPARPRPARAPCAGGATTSATSITTRFARVCVAFIFGAALVWRGREGRARGSPGGQGSLLKLLA
jgi:hypothetical protein